jgi:hypothetical protein
MRTASLTARRAGAIAALAAGLASTAAVGAWAAWHTPAQVTRARLVGSVQGEVGTIDPSGRCARLERRVWRCEVGDTGGSGGASYRIEIDGDNRCWRGVAEWISGRAPQSISGCVS